AREAYSDEHAALFDELEDIKEDTVDALQRGIQRIPLFPQQAAHIRAQREALIQQFRAYEIAIESAVNQLLARYRDSNKATRRTPAPQHFNQPWRLPESLLKQA